MSADDCYQLGVQLHKNENYHYAIMWLNEALSQMKNGSYSEMLEENINGYLAMAHVETGIMSIVQLKLFIGISKFYLNI